jgi:hypothetical protein
MIFHRKGAKAQRFLSKVVHSGPVSSTIAIAMKRFGKFFAPWRLCGS